MLAPIRRFKAIPNVMKKMRLAYFTPLTPQRSGLSDYSEELLPHLGELADIDVVVGAYQPTNDAILRRFRVIRTTEFLREAGIYDSVIYQLSNNLNQHSYMIPSLRAVPGIVVLHDYCLHYLVLGLTLLRGDMRSLKEILKPLHGSRTDALVRKLLFSAIDPLEISFARPFIEMSKAVIVHSEYARQRVEADFPHKAVAAIPMGTVDVAGGAAKLLKKKYDFCDDDFILVSATTSAYNKRLSLVLTAVLALRSRFPQLKLVILGGGPLSPQEKRLIEHSLVRSAVVQTGWLPADVYGEYIHLADAVVDVRYPSGGETSASLVRAMAAGKPLVVSAQGSFMEIPDECCIRIPVNGSETENLTQALESLIVNPEQKLILGRASREFFASKLQLRQAALSYVEFSAQMVSVATRPVSKVSFSARTSALERILVSSTYRFFRLTKLLRNYGLVAVVRRIRSELGYRGQRADGRPRSDRLPAGWS